MWFNSSMKSTNLLSSKISEAIESEHFNMEGFGDNDHKFINRIYAEGLKKYIHRIESLSFVDEERVLDAGCGFGQWSVALALLNKQIYSCDICPNRVRFLKETARYLSIDNIYVDVGVNPANYEDNYFDAIFCYGVIFLTPWKSTVKEFYRLLKPGGKLYINYTDIGWYLFTWLTEHNKANDYDPKQMAANAFKHTLDYERDSKSHEVKSIYHYQR